MSITIQIPYPTLLRLSNGVVTKKHDYYIIDPHKTIRLLIKPEERKNNPGLYIFSSGSYLFKEVSRLKSSKIIYNLDKDEQPWLFMDEKAPSFQKDIEMLIEMIKTLRSK